MISSNFELAHLVIYCMRAAMTLHRRGFLHLAAAALLPGSSRIATAQAYQPTLQRQFAAIEQEIPPHQQQTWDGLAALQRAEIERW